MMHLAMEAYLRPGEITKIRVSDLVPPVGGVAGSCWSLILHPIEEGKVSKAQEFDETLLLDLPEQAVLAETIYRVLRLGLRSPREKIFKATAKDLGKMMDYAATHLLMESLGAPHPYRLRHAGASRDFLSKARTMSEIQQRGRWKAAASVRRYQKGGRIQQQLHSLPPNVLREAQKAARDRVKDLRNLHF